MSQQYPPNPQQPQQPGYGYPQQPGQPQPGWGAPQQQWGAPPPPKKGGAGKAFGIGCLSIIGLFVVFGIIAAVAGSGGSDDKKSTSSKPAASAPAEQPADDAPAAKPEKKAPKVVTFKVWGTAPNGVDVDYGSDTDSRSGHFKGGKFEATLPLKKDALYFHVMGQLQGGGDIQCSVTVDGETKKGHASGDYNICDAQLNAGIFGGWS